MTNAPPRPDVVALSLSHEVKQLAERLKAHWYWKAEADVCVDLSRQLATLADDIVFVESEAEKRAANERHWDD